MPKPTFFALPDDKRARVIDAAVVEFARVPYAKASLDVVAKNAGVSKGSLYQYFDDKRDLYGWLVLTAMPARKLAAAAAATVTTTTGARTGTSHEPLTAPLERPHPRASRDPSPTAWERGEEPWRALANGLIVGLRAAATDELAAAWAALGVRASAPAGDIDADVVHGALRDTRHQALVQLTTQLQRAGQLRSDVSTDLAAELVGHLFGQGLLSTLARRAGVAPDDYAALPRAVAALDDDVIAAVVDDVVRVAGDGLAPPCSPRG